MRYTIGDFMDSNNVYISTAAQNMPLFPMSLGDAKLFFKYFKYESFEFDAMAKSIDIRGAKYDLPKSSWADGYIYSQNMDELDVIADKCNLLPNPTGKIYLAYGGHNKSPHIKVEKLSYLFWNNGIILVPPCDRCKSYLTQEDHIFDNDNLEIYIECMECGKRVLQGNFRSGDDYTYVKV